MTLDVNLTITGDISKLHVGPQDAVLFKLIADYPITSEQLDQVMRALKDRFWGLGWVDRIIVVDGRTIEVSVLEGANPTLHNNDAPNSGGAV